MKRPIMLAAIVLAAFAAFADPAIPACAIVEREDIWPSVEAIPDFQPRQIALRTEEKAAPEGHDKAMPHLEWYQAPKAEGKTDACMIIISGGAYQNCCDGYWVDWLARRLVKRGVTCVSLVYRTPRPSGLPIYQSGWQDGQRAVRLVRSQAAKRGYDPEKIGAMGFSAGSHLTVMLATSALSPAYAKVDAVDDIPCHVNWAVPIYTAYGLTDGLTGPNSRDGDSPDVKLNPSFKFDEKTCPMCMFHGGIDIYSPNASTQIYRQLRRMKIPAELHLFGGRNHGFFSGAKPGTGAANWYGRIEEFMTQMGYLGPVPPEEKLMDRFPSDADRAIYAKEDVWPGRRIPDLQKSQLVPYIEWHIPSNLTTKAIQIIYSGGSYMSNSPDSFEVAPARRYLNSKGMAVVTLRYRTPRPAAPLAKHVTAWQDLQRAIRLVRSKAASYGLDPNRIGIMGSSAGGHLTILGATSSRHRAYFPVSGDKVDALPCKVQWAVAIYPAYALTDGLDKGNVTGGNDDEARLAPEFSFDVDTCPMLFVHGDADGWAAMNSVKCWEQLRRMGIQGDLHTLALRNHCFQNKASPGTGSYTWLDRIWEFMVDKGIDR